MSLETLNLIKAAVPSAVITETKSTVSIEVDSSADKVLVGLILAQH